METVTINLADLKLDPHNARKHSAKNLEAIANSLSKFGQRKPIVISADKTILAGNGTVVAAKQLGWKTVVATVAPKEWDSDTAKAYALADNRTAELAEWDDSILAKQLIELDTAGWDLTNLGFENASQPTNQDLENAFNALNNEKSILEQITFTLHKDQMQTMRNALEASKALGEYGDTGNENSNGNAIARVCELWLGKQT